MTRILKLLKEILGQKSATIWIMELCVSIKKELIYDEFIPRITPYL